AARPQSPHPVQDLQGSDPQVPHRFHGSLHQQPRRTGLEDDESEDQNLRRLPHPARRRRLRPPALRDLVGPKAGLQHPQSPDPRPRTTGRRPQALSAFPSPPTEPPENQPEPPKWSPRGRLGSYHYVWRAVEALDLSQVRRIAADETSARRGHDYISLFVDMARRKVIYVADGKDAATVKEFADFLEAHGGKREAVTDASIDMGAAFEAGIKANFENAEITFDKFHVIKLANEAVDEVRRQEAKTNFQIKGRRYIFLKNVDHLTQEEKEALSRLEAQNLDTIQAMQIRMNLQQLFTM